MMRWLQALPVDAWPEADRLAWSEAFREGDVFDGRGAGYHLSEGSRRTLLLAYRAWLGHLRDVDPAALGLPPADRVTPDRVRGYIAAMRARNLAPSSVWNGVKHLYDSLRVIAPETDWPWLKVVKRRLEAQVPRHGNIRPFVHAGRLCALGVLLMDEARNVLDQNPLPCAVRYRTGLCIALLASRPFRRRTLAALRIGQHLVRYGETWMLLIPAEDTKSRRPEEWLFPLPLVPYLEHYLGSVRRHFRGAERHEWLWASEKGGGLSAEWIYQSVRRATEDAFGVPVTLHAFRGAVTTGIAYDAPEKIGIASHLLNHCDPRTTERYYNMAMNLQACRRNAEHLARRKEQLRATYRRTKRTYP